VKVLLVGGSLVGFPVCDEFLSHGWPRSFLYVRGRRSCGGKGGMGGVTGGVPGGKGC
jgi:hypothetical protein